ncbi:DUF4185 domain-containing protein [Spongiimicrobium sp. 3-5]|uniref:DUF4185 domain-containing protein n=1 Tax=Spongiimicrobium sp. 3-5 TaxID=3332596 RepID=UPI0039808EBC
MRYFGLSFSNGIIKSAILLVVVICIACGENKKNRDGHPDVLVEDSTVVKAARFNKLVIVDSLGVTGADGAISFPLSNGNSVFMMGDSFLEPVMEGKRNPKSKMINNTFIVTDTENSRSTSIFKNTLDNPETMLIPINDNGIKEYYWPGHGFEFNNELHIFMSKFTHDTQDVDNTWGFAYTGTDYLKLEKDTYKIIAQQDFPYSNQNGVHYGHSIVKEDDYTYIYGSKVEGENAVLHVARGKISEKDSKLSDYQFFNGSNWVNDPTTSQNLKGIEKQVPEQFSVFKHNDTYVLLLQERDLVSGNIYSYIADSPTGPWTNEKLLYHTTDQEQYKEDKVFTYNAMAHPQYIEDDKLLVSYCVNSFNVPSIHDNVDYYRPQFIWIPITLILN